MTLNKQQFRGINVLLIVLFSLIFNQTFFSQTKLNGKVFEINEKSDSLPLPGTMLRWEGFSEPVVANENGDFTINKNKLTNRLIISNIGFTTDTIEIDTNQLFIFIVLRDIKELKEVQIIYKTTGSELSMMSSIKTEILNQRELMKAACCNLSESFETNASIDVNFSDAVTGTKQIQMLGLSGQYAMITKDNMPYLRGLAGIYGLNFVPGSWIQSIQLSKGAGTVINGYESFTGQINTELQNPATSEKLFFNAYVNANARNEYNLNLSKKLTDVWSTNLLLHGSSNPLKQDMNKDGFMDIPVGTQINVLQKWVYQTRKGFEGQFGASYVDDNRNGGQDAKFFKTKSDTTPFYKIGIQSKRFDAFAKNGYVLKRPSTSMGLQLNFSNHEQVNFYGNRPYSGTQKTIYANFIFESYLINTNHKYKIGSSFILDELNEKFEYVNFKRTEQVPGTFAEYTYNYKTTFNLVAGARADYHNYYGLFFTPRLHLRYAFNDNKSVLRLSGGRALRTPNLFAENTSLMASARVFEIHPSNSNLPYGLNAEIAWNYGMNYTQKFKLDFRDAYITLDAYRTDFENQLIVDLDVDSKKVIFSNLNGVSFSNTAQVEFGWEMYKRLNVKTAYRFVENKSTFSKGLLDKALVSKHRAFLNLGYENKNGKWLSDLTIQWFGPKRLPNTQNNPIEYKRDNYSPAFFNVNGQITYVHKKKNEWHFYLGVENALNFRQNNPIVSSDQPFGKWFDASMVWGSIYGRMLYGGLRFKIK
jgi:hypothetical protein